MAESKAEPIFSTGGKSLDVLRSWWDGLATNRGGRAELRRAFSPAEVVYSPIYHDLVRAIAMLSQPFSKEKLATVAGLVARIKSDTGDGHSFAAQLAAPRMAGGGAVVSGLRFRRLLAVKDEDHDELYPMLIRTLDLLGGIVNLADLARSVYWWNESTKKHWAYDYYAAAPSEK